MVVSEETDLNPFLEAIRRAFLPNVTLRVWKGEPGPEAPESVRGKRAIDGKTTAYVCRGFTCSLTLHSPQALREALEKGAQLRLDGSDDKMTQ